MGADFDDWERLRQETSLKELLGSIELASNRDPQLRRLLYAGAVEEQSLGSSREAEGGELGARYGFGGCASSRVVTGFEGLCWACDGEVRRRKLEQ